MLTRPAVLMSKHWMDKVWSWDHCFNALALAAGCPQLAWEQFQVVFDHQDAAGALPDSIAHSEVLYNFVKPPIHGWTLSALRRTLPDLPDEEIAETYRRLERWTRYWLDCRQVPGSDLAHYHHGNDSGWDNATTFDQGASWRVLTWRPSWCCRCANWPRSRHWPASRTRHSVGVTVRN
jgi:hypothetical protein